MHKINLWEWLRDTSAHPVCWFCAKWWWKCSGTIDCLRLWQPHVENHLLTEINKEASVMQQLGSLQSYSPLKCIGSEQNWLGVKNSDAKSIPNWLTTQNQIDLHCQTKVLITSDLVKMQLVTSESANVDSNVSLPSPTGFFFRFHFCNFLPSFALHILQQNATAYKTANLKIKPTK